MPRIRSIKPEFWQDEELAQCSPHARLFAIAILQLCDSEGRFKWINMQIHAHAFPYEPKINVEKLAGELQGIGYMTKYEINGKTYACVTNFNKHQRLTGKESQTKSAIPSPGNNGETPGCFPEKHLDAQEREREREKEGEREWEGVPGKPIAKIPYPQIMAAYHRICHMLPPVVKLSDKRKAHLRQRWQNDLRTLEEWETYFADTAASKFLTGQKPPTPPRTKPFRANLDFLLREQTVIDMQEGKYHD